MAFPLHLEGVGGEGAEWVHMSIYLHLQIAGGKGTEEVQSASVYLHLQIAGGKGTEEVHLASVYLHLQGVKDREGTFNLHLPSSTGSWR